MNSEESSDFPLKAFLDIKKRPEDRDRHPTDTAVNIPSNSKRTKTFSSLIMCKGCQMPFPCNYWGKETIPSPDYYLHCVERCEKYKALGLARECRKCNRKFLNQNALHSHQSECSPHLKKDLLAKKPKWMPRNLMELIIKKSRFDETIACNGCNNKFPCYKKGRHSIPSLEFYVHAIEQCNDYKGLGLIRECDKCKCKFLNSTSLARHKKCYPGQS